MYPLPPFVVTFRFLSIPCDLNGVLRLGADIPPLVAKLPPTRRLLSASSLSNTVINVAVVHTIQKSVIMNRFPFAGCHRR